MSSPKWLDDCMTCLREVFKDASKALFKRIEYLLYMLWLLLCVLLLYRAICLQKRSLIHYDTGLQGDFTIVTVLQIFKGRSLLFGCSQDQHFTAVDTEIDLHRDHSGFLSDSPKFKPSATIDIPNWSSCFSASVPQYHSQISELRIKKLMQICNLKNQS